MEHPPQRFVKLNFDESLIHNSAAGGFIIRYWAGKLITAGATHYEDSTILVVEARTLRSGIHGAVKVGSKRILVEGNNATVI